MAGGVDHAKIFLLWSGGVKGGGGQIDPDESGGGDVEWLAVGPFGGHEGGERVGDGEKWEE